MSRIRNAILGVAFLAAALLASETRAADSLIWSTNKSGVVADIKEWTLPKLLAKISALTGWQVKMEPGTAAIITARFKNVPPDDALNRLLGNINFTRDSSNGVSRLLVYRTVPGAATQPVEPSPPEAARDYRIPNELLVLLKRNSTESIDDLAKALGAKIVRRDDRLKLYRLQFADADAATAAANQLGGDNSVGLVDSNYVVDRPAPIQSTPLTGVANPTPGAVGTVAGGASQIPALNVNPDPKGVVIGLIDTAVQMQNGFSQYSLTPITVVGQPNEPADQISHGTAMFEDLLQGMATDPSKILPVDVYPSGDSTTTFELADGFATAVNAGATAINLSCGGTGDSAALHSLIDAATQKGILVVAASGNTPGAAPTYPAAYPGVLAITASDPNGQLASYANDGPFVRAMEPAPPSFISTARHGKWKAPPPPPLLPPLPLPRSSTSSTSPSARPSPNSSNPTPRPSRNSLIAHQLPPALVRLLEDQGHMARHVRELGLNSSDDATIWRHATANDMVVVSEFQPERHPIHPIVPQAAGGDGKLLTLNTPPRRLY